MGRRVGGSTAITAGLAAAQGLNDPDAHALAGFIEAEGSFGIHHNNGGRSWSCSCSIALRADDGDVLVDLQRVTGMGRLSAKPARRGSREQLEWRISSKLECQALARVLADHPLRGRKRKEAIVWSTAVESWAADPYGRGDPVLLGEARARLRELKRYDNDERRWEPALHASRDVLEAYLGGFFSGDGSFVLDNRTARMVVKLRRDDRPLLELFATSFGLGDVYDYAPGERQACAIWMVLRQDELAAARSMLERAVLRGRKRREFVAWCEGVDEFIAARTVGRPRDPKRIADAAAALRAERSYAGPVAWERPAVDREAVRRTYADILRRAACGATDLSCSAYERERRSHPSWPTRTTIALAFGGWREAVEQALG